MMFPRILRSHTPGLMLGLALALWLSSTGPASGQSQSSGSGVGTGTGSSGGVSRNSTGTGESGGVGTNPTRAGSPSEPTNNLLLPGGRQTLQPSGPLPRIPQGGGTAPGPGINVTFPDENPMIPLGDLTERDAGSKAHELSEVTDEQLKYARRIPAAGDRSLALSRIAGAATFSNQLDLADTALIDASNAALQMSPGMVQDQRLISIITALMGLGEARLREGKPDNTSQLFPTPTTPSVAPIPKIAPAKMIRLAQTDYRRAAFLAQKIGNKTYRSEMLYRVAENLSYASQSIVNEYPRVSAGSDSDAGGLNTSYEGLPDQFLQEAANVATRIERPVWHDQGLVRVATAAAESKQFSRALTVSRMIPQPEVRANALMKVAEIQARRGDATGATPTYREAALAVASIVQEDPRAVLAGVLVDNLVAVGRFEDARASVVLYPDEPRRRVALGAIAEAMGYRGASASALRWINSDAPPEIRSQLYRRVNNGVVAAIQSNRSKDMSSPAR